LDRWYASVSVADQLAYQIQTRVLRLPEEWRTYYNATDKKQSVTFDHAPVLLSVSCPSRDSTPRFPVWAARDPKFPATVRAFFNAGGGGSRELGPGARLDLLKESFWQAARLLKRTPRAPRLARDKLAVAVEVYRRLDDAVTPEDYKHIFDRTQYDERLSDLIVPVVDVATGYSAVEVDWQKLRDYIGELAMLDVEQRTRDQAIREAKAETKATHSTSRAERLRRLRPGGKPRIAELAKDSAGDERTSDGKVAAQWTADYWGRVWSRKAGLRPGLLRKLAPQLGNAAAEHLHLMGVLSVKRVQGIIEATGNSHAGPDGVPFAAWRAVSELAAEIIVDLMEHVSGGGALPAGFNVSLLFLLGKKPLEAEGTLGQLFTAGGCRPISCGNADARIWASCLVAMLEPVLEQIIPKSQKGFLRARDIADAILDVNDWFYGEQASGRLGFLYLLDFKEAFPSVSHGAIMEMMEWVGLPLPFRRLVAALYVDLGHMLVWQGGRYTTASAHSGVKQGCPLSPLILLLVLAPLLARLERMELGVAAMADDIAVFLKHEGPRGSQLYRKLPELVWVFRIFARATGMELNHAKSVLLTTRGGPIPALYAGVIARSGWRNFPVVDEAVHLGVLIGSEVGATEVFSRPLNKVATEVMLWSSVALPPATRILVCNIYLLSIMGYIGRMFLMPPSVVTALRGHLRRFMLKGLPVPMDTVFSLRAEFGLRPQLRHPEWANVSFLLASVAKLGWRSLAGTPRARFRPNSPRIREHVTEAERRFLEATGLPMSPASPLPGKKPRWGAQFYAALEKAAGARQVGRAWLAERWRAWEGGPPRFGLREADFEYVFRAVRRAAKSLSWDVVWVGVCFLARAWTFLWKAGRSPLDEVECVFCGSSQDRPEHHVQCEVVRAACQQAGVLERSETCILELAFGRGGAPGRAFPQAAKGAWVGLYGLYRAHIELRRSRRGRVGWRDEFRPGAAIREVVGWLRFAQARAYRPKRGPDPALSGENRDVEGEWFQDMYGTVWGWIPKLFRAIGLVSGSPSRQAVLSLAGDAIGGAAEAQSGYTHFLRTAVSRIERMGDDGWLFLLGVVDP